MRYEEKLDELILRDFGEEEVNSIYLQNTISNEKPNNIVENIINTLNNDKIICIGKEKIIIYPISINWEFYDAITIDLKEHLLKDIDVEIGLLGASINFVFEEGEVKLDVAKKCVGFKRHATSLRNLEAMKVK